VSRARPLCWWVGWRLEEELSVVRPAVESLVGRHQAVGRTDVDDGAGATLREHAAEYLTTQERAGHVDVERPAKCFERVVFEAAAIHAIRVGHFVIHRGVVDEHVDGIELSEDGVANGEERIAIRDVGCDAHCGVAVLRFQQGGSKRSMNSDALRYRDRRCG
jgi:hypothetical protein